MGLKSSGKISLVVEGENMSIESLDLIIGIRHSMYKKKGECVSRVLDVLEHDIAQYTGKFDSENMNSVICEFCNIISKTIDKIDKDYLCKIRIYIQSDYSQMYWKLQKQTIEALHSCNLDCEFSVLSWGECEP